ncbi:MAG: SulP family inorganic anion transporter [bacterium]|nr:SulP family inorganic anion transporter [bacterium]
MSYNLHSFREDAFGGITAAVVGLPTALAFGVASGLGAVAGMYGAIALGLFAAVFGGTRAQISGPTGPMALAMAVVVTSHADSLEEAFTIVIMAGLLQICLGLLRIGRFVVYTPYSVVSGFMSGIGVIIILVQTLPFLGADVELGGPIDAVRSWPDVFGDVNFSSLGIAAVSLGVCIFWPPRLRTFVPSMLMALVIGTLLSLLWLDNTPVIGDVPTGLPDFELPELSGDVLAGAVQPALTIALLGSIDSLLTSLVADSMTRTSHQPNRELIGQGIGNMMVGFIGGTPGAGATMGTVVNIRAGGHSRVSGVLRALILLALVLGLGKYVEEIPHAALAGILMKVGWDIMDWRFLTKVTRLHREHLFIMFATFGLTVFVDLITAVAIGLIIAGMTRSRQFERLEMDNVVSVPILDQLFFKGEATLSDEGADPHAARVGMVAFRGSFSVASSNKIINTVTVDIRDHEVVIFDFSETIYVDDSAALVLEQLIDAAIDQATECIVMALSGLPARTLQSLDILQRVPEDRIVGSLDEARDVARRLLGA